MKIGYELRPQEQFKVHYKIKKNLAIHVKMPKRRNVVTSQTPVVSMTTRLIVNLLYLKLDNTSNRTDISKYSGLPF